MMDLFVNEATATVVIVIVSITIIARIVIMSFTAAMMVTKVYYAKARAT